MNLRNAEELSYTQIREIDKRKTVCFLPVSALEVHGPHLPLGMDLYMARWMAEEAGRRFAANHPDWTVIQYPPLPLGTDELPLAGSMNTNQRTVYTGLRDQGESLARAGFEFIVVTNGHGGPRHASGIEAACRRVSRKTGASMFSPSIAVMHAIITGAHFDFIEEQLGRPLSDAERDGMLSGEHAGTWETSFMLAQNPDLVEEGYQHLAKNGPPTFGPLQAAGEKFLAFREKRGADTSHSREVLGAITGGLGWLLNTRYGYAGPAISYQGTPAVASAEIGHIFRELLANGCHELVEDVTSGRKSAVDVRSIASDPLVIQPGVLSGLGMAAAAVIALLVLL